MLIFLSFSCTDTEKSTSDTSITQFDTATEDTAIEDTATEDTATEEKVCAPLDLDIEWQEEAIVLSLHSFDDQGAYYFGLAQTKANVPNQWTGEDCLLGYTTEDTVYSYCHPARDGLALEYGAPYDDVIEGLSTHFAGSQFMGEVTYIIKEAISGCCWAWGLAPDYYQGLNCLPLEETTED